MFLNYNCIIVINHHKWILNLVYDYLFIFHKAAETINWSFNTIYWASIAPQKIKLRSLQIEPLMACNIDSIKTGCRVKMKTLFNLIFALFWLLLNFHFWSFTNHLMSINSSLVKSEKEAIIVHHWIQKWLRKMINLWILKEHLKTSAAFARHNGAKNILSAHLKLFLPNPLVQGVSVQNDKFKPSNWGIYICSALTLHFWLFLDVTMVTRVQRLNLSVFIELMICDIYSVIHISMHHSKRFCSKMAPGEIGVSLPWWCHTLVLLSPGYKGLFLNFIIFS